MKVKWYSKGKFIEDDNFSPKIEPYLKIVKCKYSDEYSYKGYRYLIVNPYERTILINAIRNEFEDNSMGHDSIGEIEYDLIKNDKIWLTNNKTPVINLFSAYKWSEILKYFPEDVFYI